MTHALEICTRCGWPHPGFDPHNKNECSEVAGASAERLQSLIMPIDSTKLGYGYGRLNVEFDDRFAVTLDCHDDGTFSLCAAGNFFLLDHMTERRAVDLIEALALWRHGGRPRGAEDTGPTRIVPP